MVTRTFCCVVMLILVFMNAVAIAKEYKEGYQCAKWEMSIDQVKRCFKGESFTSDGQDVISYQKKVAGDPIKFSFFFNRNRLFRVLLEVETGDYTISKFIEYEKLLTEQYGPSINRKPFDEQLTLSVMNDLLTSKRKNYAMQWSLDESTITIMLSNQSNGLNLGIIYDCKDTFGMSEQDKKTKKDHL